MASKYSNNEINKSVSRETVNRLQEKLFKAAEAALDQAIDEGNIPAALLSSTQSILRDAGIAPDLTDVEAQKGSADDLSDVPTPDWLSNLRNDLNL